MVQNLLKKVVTHPLRYELYIFNTYLLFYLYLKYSHSFYGKYIRIQRLSKILE